MKYTKEYIKSKLPEIRQIKIYTKKPAYPSKIKDQVLIDNLYALLNSKGFADEFELIEEDSFGDFSDHTVTEILQKRYSKANLQKYKNEPFNLKKIYEKVSKEAAKVTNIHSELNHEVVVSTYWVGKQEVFPGVDFKKLVDNYNLRGSIINEVMEYVCKHRNLPNSKLAIQFNKEDLIGKFTVTENNVLSGFMKNSMTLKYVGYLPGKIVETRYGKRHGIDNFWDDHVSERDFLVLNITNSTGAKEIEKWKKKQYAIDITPTLQVFNTFEEAIEVANQLNEFYKKTLTLNY